MLLNSHLIHGIPFFCTLGSEVHHIYRGQCLEGMVQIKILESKVRFFFLTFYCFKIYLVNKFKLWLWFLFLLLFLRDFMKMSKRVIFFQHKVFLSVILCHAVLLSGQLIFFSFFFFFKLNLVIILGYDCLFLYLKMWLNSRIFQEKSAFIRSSLHSPCLDLLWFF